MFAPLMREGLDRHDAIYAIGSALIGIIFDATKNNAVAAVPKMPALCQLQTISRGLLHEPVAMLHRQLYRLRRNEIALGLTAYVQ